MVANDPISTKSTKQKHLRSMGSPFGNIKPNTAKAIRRVYPGASFDHGSNRSAGMNPAARLSNSTVHNSFSAKA
jgi:hypothetical protein